MSALSSRMLTMLSTPMTLSHSANDSYRKKIRAIKVADTTVSVTRTVKSLGVTVDSTLSFDQHVNNVCKAAHVAFVSIQLNHYLLTYLLTYFMTCF